MLWATVPNPPSSKDGIKNQPSRAPGESIPNGVGLGMGNLDQGNETIPYPKPTQTIYI